MRHNSGMQMHHVAEPHKELGSESGAERHPLMRSKYGDDLGFACERHCMCAKHMRTLRLYFVLASSGKPVNLLQTDVYYLHNLVHTVYCSVRTVAVLRLKSLSKRRTKVIINF